MKKNYIHPQTETLVLAPGYKMMEECQATVDMWFMPGNGAHNDGGSSFGSGVSEMCSNAPM